MLTHSQIPAAFFLLLGAFLPPGGKRFDLCTRSRRSERVAATVARFEDEDFEPSSPT
jgi:hypothetical protein